MNPYKSPLIHPATEDYEEYIKGQGKDAADDFDGFVKKYAKDAGFGPQLVSDDQVLLT